jgi:poly(hydroxyalkanoate) granule-associated protein
MAKKTDESNEGTGGFSGLGTNSVKDSAQQIWLAGLGAFAKAQEEGTKVFEALVKEGIGMQRKSQTAAEEKLSEAASKMAGMASGLQGKTPGPWDKLENIFEDRVGRALKKLGAPSAEDFQAMSERIEALTRQIEQLSAGSKSSATKAPRKAAAKSAAETGAPASAPSRKVPASTRRTSTPEE